MITVFQAVTSYHAQSFKLDVLCNVDPRYIKDNT